MYVDVVGSNPVDESVAAIPEPTLSNGSHLSYTVQWFLFTLAVLTGWVLAVRKHITGERKAGLKAERAALAAH